MKRRALSPVVSTMFLVAAMLVILIAVLGFSVNLFAVQTQEAEFVQAQNLMVNFAQGVDSVTGNPGASTYVTFNARAGGPNLIPGFDTFNLKLNFSCYWSGNKTNAQGNKWSANGLTYPANVLRYRVGPLVSFAGYQWIRGPIGNTSTPGSNKTLLVQNSTLPTGWVYISHVNPTDQGSTWVTLDNRRANILNLGLFNVSKGVVIEKKVGVGLTQWVDFVQVQYTNVTFSGAPYGGANNIVASAVNKGVVVLSCFVNGGSKHATTATSSLLAACDGGKPLSRYAVRVTSSRVQNPTPPDKKVYTLPIACYQSHTFKNGTTFYYPVSTQFQFVISNIQLALSGG
jgi:hypothetical protein